MPPFHTEQLRKLFIGGLNLDTTEDGLKEYFSRWGETVDVVVMRFPDTKRSRGFGFVTYENVESVDAVLNAKPHVLDGKEIEPKRAVAKDETTSSGRQDSEGSNKIFVGGLASATTEDDVRKCFEKFCEEAGHGKVEEILIMKDRESDRLRGFCFVTFDSKEIVDKICSVKYFEIRTKTVEVRRAESRMTMMRKEQRDYGYTRRQMDDRRRDNDSYQDSGRMRNNYGSGFNQMSMQGPGGSGMPFFGGSSSGGSRGGSGGFGGGFNMNPMALAGMMSMFMNQMGGMGSMGMGNMGGGSMGNMGMNSRGSGDGIGSRGGDPGDSFRGPSSSSDGYKSNNYSSGSVSTSNTTGSDGGGYGAQNSSMYGDQAGGGMGDMSAYANAMSAMFGAAGVSPANVQAALYNAYGGGGGGTGSGSGQMGAYDQSSSAYGPARNSSTSTNRGYKPY